MLNTLWFLFKIAVALALILWIAEHPGNIALEWMDYKLTLHIGVFAAGLLFLIFGSILVYRIFKTITGLPQNVAQRHETKVKKRGYAALTRGLSAVAAGDLKTAAKAAKESARLLDDKDAGDAHALTLLLQAQTAQMQGKPEIAHAAFTRLADHKDGSFLGIRGLLRTALENNDLAEARTLSDKALRNYPSQIWILKTAFDIRVRQKDWPSALDVRKKLHKINAYTNDNQQNTYEDDLAALYTAQGLDALKQNNITDAIKAFKQALKTTPDFVPAALYLAQTYRKADKQKSAIKAIEHIWKKKPHPDLVPLWMDLLAEKKKLKSSARMEWIEHLVIINTESIESHLAAARQAIKESLWGEARSYLERALTLEPDARIYELLIQLEREATHDLSAIDKWTQDLENAPLPPCWICTNTGRLYDKWSPIAKPHGSFNTIHWQKPNTYIQENNISGMLVHDASAL